MANKIELIQRRKIDLEPKVKAWTEFKKVSTTINKADLIEIIFDKTEWTW